MSLSLGRISTDGPNTFNAQAAAGVINRELQNENSPVFQAFLALLRSGARNV